MSSDEEYLDDLLKSIAEDEGESGHVETDSEENLSLDDLEPAIEDTDGIVGAEDMDPSAEDLGIGDIAAEDLEAMEALAGEMELEGASNDAADIPEKLEEEVSLEDFALEAFEEEEAVENPAAEDAAEGEPTESAVFEEAMEEPVEEDSLNDLALEDFGEEEPLENLMAEDLGEEAPENPVFEEAIEEPVEEDSLNDLALEDFGEEEPLENLMAEDLGEEAKENPVFEEAIEEPMEEDSLNDLALEDFGEEEPLENLETEDFGGEITENPVSENAGEQPEDDFAIEDFGVVEPEEGELDITGGTPEDESPISDAEVDAMFAAADAAAMEEEAAIEINTEEDMLALLDSMSNEIEAENAAAEQAAAELAEAAAGEEAEEDGKGKKKKKKRFGGKKKGEKEAGESAEGEEAAAEEIEKKPNFFTKLLAFLTETDEDEEEEAKDGLEPSDENKSILEELEKEDKKKKKKKDKGKKGKEEDGDGEEEGKKKEKKEKKKKEKKEKKDKAAADTLETEPSRPSKKISKKSVAVIMGLCLTLLVMIIVFSSIVPAFFDKKDARDAYYQSDYAKAYELLYGKQLDNSDTIIYNQSKIIVEMNRKLDAYHNYLAIGEDVRALDALMMGVQKYPDILLDAEEYHVTQEVDAVYETILNILNDKYDLTETMAKIIIDYDDVTYTKKLESVVNGTLFEDPYAEDKTSSDILPEEQDFFVDTPTNVLEGNTETVENTAGDIPADTALLDGTQEEVPADAAEENPTADAPDTTSVPGENIEPEITYIPEEPSTVDSSIPNTDSNTDGTAYIPSGSGSGSQGQMIQGVRQPLDVQIHQ